MSLMSKHICGIYNWQLATGNWQLANWQLATVELKYTVLYLVSQSGLVKSDWNISQKWSTGWPSHNGSDGTLIREFPAYI